MNEVITILGVNWNDMVKQAIPTGCASFQMSAGATTVHRLFGLSLAPKRDGLDPKEVKMLEQKFKKVPCLLVIDEFSMESRAMIGVIIDRLRTAHINLDQVGIILIGDPAQLLPIGGEPLWSIKTKRESGHDFTNESYLGLVEFRSLFRMSKLEQIPNYNVWHKNATIKNPSESQRKQNAEFTAAAMEGDYEAVYLTEVKRSITGDRESYKMITELIPKCRFGKLTEIDLLKLKNMFATKEEVSKDEQFCKARIVQGYHFYADHDPTRKNVESDNIRKIFDLAKNMNDKPIVHLQSLHMPMDSSASLAMISGKEFEGLLKDFLAFDGMPLMLLTNTAPQFGLFNGATCLFRGLLYLPDHPIVTLTSSELKKAKFNNMTIVKPLELKSASYCTQFYQLPKNSILIAINNKSVTSVADINTAIASEQPVECHFKIPKCPPALPDFIVVESNAYKDRGGPNILGFPGGENLVPIPCTKILRKKQQKDKKASKKAEHRIGFKVECAIAVTPYKEQGRNEERLIMEIKNLVCVPGLFYVSVSRTTHPKHNHIPEGQWPSAMEINMQRLNPVVI